MKLKRFQGGALACAAVFTSQLHAETAEPVYELDEFIVSTGPGIRSVADYAPPVNIVTSEELQRESGGTLAAVLDWQPGVTTSSFTAGASRPILRGFDGPRISILESGLNSLDASDTSPDHGVAMEPLLTDRIEVLRGPATLLYGSSAIGGAVNVIGKELPRQPVGEDGYEGAVEARYDTVSNGETFLGYATVGQEEWALTVTGLDREAEDYEIPDDAQDEDEPSSTLENSFFESSQYSVGSSWFFTPENRLGFSYSRYESSYGLPGEHDEGHGHGGGGGGGHGGEESVAIDLERDRYDMELELVDLNEWISALRMRLAYTDYEHEEYTEDESTIFERDGWEFRTEAAHTQWSIVDEGVVGIQASDSDFAIIGDEAFVAPSTTQTQALFATQHIHNGDLHYEFGGRIERADINIDDSSLDDYDEVAFSFAASAIWNIDEINSLSLVLQRAARHPNATELYAEGEHHAIGIYERGDDSLDEEIAYGVDLTYRTQVAGWNAELSAFYTYFDDYIFAEENGEEIGPPGDEQHVFQYVGVKAEFYGFEAATEKELLRTSLMTVNLQLMADYVSATNKEENDSLPRIPPMRLGSRLGVDWGDWEGGLELRYAFKQDDTAHEESETDGYTELNADISRRVEFSNGTAAVFFARAENLLDQEIRNHTSFTKDAAALPGRNLTIGGRFEF